MTEYDFDRIIDRRNTNSYKWDSATDSDVLPMWVADMDFQTAPCIMEALRRRVEHGIFGYTKVPPQYYDTIVSWFASRHGLHIDRDWIIYTTGVVPAISAIIKAMCRPGDKVVVQTPVYNCFFSSIRNNDCAIEVNPLVFRDDTYVMDYEDLERKVADPQVKLLILCNPHNPAGRVWREDELRRVGDICFRHDVKVLSDEIHCELVFPPHHHTPFASLGESFADNSVTCTSPSKAFNIAGLQIANIFVKDEELRRKIDRAININEVCDVNPFGVEALIAAYSEGEDWLNALIAYLRRNYLTLCDYFAQHLPRLGVVKLEGTYLVWVDCRALALDSATLERQLLEKGRLRLNPGSMYGADGFMRINIACPRSVMLEGLDRFRKYVNGISHN